MSAERSDLLLRCCYKFGLHYFTFDFEVRIKILKMKTSQQKDANKSSTSEAG